MAHKFSMRRAGIMVFAGAAALTLAACTDIGGIPKHLRPLESGTAELIEQKGMEQTSPILIRIFKEESVLEVWKAEKDTGRLALLKSYDICKWSGELGPKIAEGDRQAPEGFYTITPAQMNPNSNYYLSFNLGFPNAFDQSLGRTGTFLMVHGACSSAGCYSMTDEQIAEIYTLARLAFQGGQRAFQVQAYPFRMTPENMARYRNDPNMPFWRMLKEGYDHFEVTRREPKVNVCSQRYVFNSVPQEGVTFSPTGACPPMSVPDPIRIAVQDKAAEDEAKFQIIAARLDEKEVRDGRSEGDLVEPNVMLAAVPEPAAPAAAVGEPAPMSVAAAPVLLEPTLTVPASSPALPATAQPAVLAAAPAPAASPIVQPGEAPLPERPAFQQPPVVANAYAPEQQESGGFFSRIISKVNPF